jgi:hypothetical protein
VRRVYSRLRKVDTARLPDNLDSPALAATVGAPVSLSSIPPELLVAVCVAALLLALVQTARLAFTRWLPRHRIAVARAAGADGELRAEPLLRALGYAVVARQAPVSYEVAVDPGTTARPSARSPRYDREAVGEESPVRPRGRQRPEPDPER